MNTSHALTQMATTRLIWFLRKVGNTLSDNHKLALCSLTDAMTRMAEGMVTGRLAFGLPTGTGKTTAIIEWCASVHALGLQRRGQCLGVGDAGDFGPLTEESFMTFANIAVNFSAFGG